MEGILNKLKFPASFLVLIFLVFPRSLFAQYNLEELKAAYIERITRFVEWPDSLTSGKTDTIVLGFAHDVDFQEFAAKIFKLQTINERPVKIIPVNNDEDLRLCNLCYIGQIDSLTLNNYVALSNSKKILLFGNTAGYAKSGIHFNFYIEDNKLKFEVSIKSIQAAGFKISHLLLKTARII
jgi:hypothetical protein